MFNFTTLTLFNTIVDTEGAKNRNLWTVSGKKPAVRIGNTRFDANQIEDILMKKYSPENLASVTFDLEDISFAEGETECIARIAIYLGLSMASQDSLYANAYVYKGKPLFIEFKVTADDLEGSAAKAKQIADKFLLLEADEKILNITIGKGKNNENTAITLTGVNGYQQIRVAKLQKFDPDAQIIDCCINQGDFVDVKVGVPVMYTRNASTGAVEIVEDDDVAQKLGSDGQPTSLATNEVPIMPGLEAFLDYNWIIHNLRLPTCANTNFWSPNKEEMPAPGQTYTQFTIKMKDTRDRVAGEGVGMRITSVTTHVLYVAGDPGTSGTPAYKVKTALTALATAASTTIKTDAEDVLADPFGTN